MTEPASPASRRDDDVRDFGLLTDDGNQRMDLLVREVATNVTSGAVERSEAVEALSDGLREIAVQNPEATDITVRDAVLRELKPSFTAAGWTPLEPYEF